MDIKEIQNKVFDVAIKRSKLRNFNLDEEICLIHLMEEVGELASQIYNKKARPDKFDKDNLDEEICDVILESLILAKLLNVDLDRKLNEKIDIINERLKKYESK